ncbi:MAG: type II secretion system protein [Magnetococcales bacterium]|nr:type II secretion system protein [Magnetococcales bacterium]
MVRSHCKHSGFTLTEMAMVILLMGIVASIGLTYFNANMRHAAYSITKKRTETIKDALVAYLRQNNKLPCPALYTALDGKAQANCNASYAASFGIVPWADLNLPRDAVLDGWENLISYHVSTQSVDWTTAAISKGNDPGDLTVTHKDASGNNPVSQGNIVLVLVSHGPNGQGAYTVKGLRNVLPPAQDVANNTNDEFENTNQNQSYVQRDFNEDPNVTGGYFDDIVESMSATDLLGQLIKEGSVASNPATLLARVAKIKAALLAFAASNSSDTFIPGWKKNLPVNRATIIVIPSIPNGHYYSTTDSGTTSINEPSWPTDGTITQDGTTSIYWKDNGTLQQILLTDPTFAATTCPWRPGMVINKATFVRPSSKNGYYYRTSAPGNVGTTPSSEPSWPSTLGDTITDASGLTWTNVGTSNTGTFPGWSWNASTNIPVDSYLFFIPQNTNGQHFYQITKVPTQSSATDSEPGWSSCKASGTNCTSGDGTTTWTYVDSNGGSNSTWSTSDFITDFPAYFIRSSDRFRLTTVKTSSTTPPSWPTDGTAMTDGIVTWTDQGTYTNRQALHRLPAGDSNHTNPSGVENDCYDSGCSLPYTPLGLSSSDIADPWASGSTNNTLYYAVHQTVASTIDPNNTHQEGILFGSSNTLAFRIISVGPDGQLNTTPTAQGSWLKTACGGDDICFDVSVSELASAIAGSGGKVDTVTCP